jgi:hypothetical protein
MPLKSDDVHTMIKVLNHILNDPEYLEFLSDSIQIKQRLYFLDIPVKYVPFAPGTELIHLNILKDALSRLESKLRESIHTNKKP